MNKLRKVIRLDFMLTNTFKFNCTVLLSLIAIAMFVINPTSGQKICMCAIFVSTIADLILMDYNNIPSMVFKNKHFYMGMLVFAVTHILYSYCFTKFIMLQDFVIKDIGVALPLSVLVMTISVSLWFYLSPKKSKIFKLASFMYMAIINVTLAVIFVCADLFNGTLVYAAIGIAMFLVSDMLILIRETIWNTESIKKAIWIFYPLGQILILCSVYGLK